MTRNDVERSATRRDFPVHYPITTRWSDNDMFGHLNNAVYYQMFDTAINGWIADTSGIDAMTIPVLGVVAQSQCLFFAELGFPEPVTVGLRVSRLGTSSVSYDLGLFGGKSDAIAAFGRWTHVYVDRVTRAPTPPPPELRDAFVSAHVLPAVARSDERDPHE